MQLYIADTMRLLTQIGRILGANKWLMGDAMCGVCCVIAYRETVKGVIDEVYATYTGEV